MSKAIKNNPTISVILPSYNMEEYLPRCVSSICDNTYQELEILIIDDGSTDNTLIISEQLAKKDPRIRVIHQQNRGLSNARNTGMRASEGEIIAFVDPDDWVDRNYFSKLQKALQETGAGIAMCGYWNVEKTGAQVEKLKIHTQETMNREEFMAFNRVKSYVWGKLYRREIIDGVLFSEQLKIEDADFNLKAIEKNPFLKAVCINEPLYFYVQRSNGLASKLQWKDYYLVAERCYNTAENLSEDGTQKLFLEDSIKRCLWAWYLCCINDAMEGSEQCERLMDRIRKSGKVSDRKLLLFIRFPFLYNWYRYFAYPSEWKKERRVQQRE